MSSTGQPRCRFATFDIPRGTGFGRHRHDAHQLLSVETGALAVGTDSQQWAVPARRGVWLPSVLDHELVAVDDAQVTFVYVDRVPPADDRLLPAVGVVAIRPLLREAMGLLARPGAARGPRRDRLQAVFLDEVAELRPESHLVVLPTYPPARVVADALLADPADDRALDDLGRAVGASARLYRRYLWRRAFRRGGHRSAPAVQRHRDRAGEHRGRAGARILAPGQPLGGGCVW